MVKEQPANFHAVKLGQAGQVECDAVVLNPPDFDDRAQAVVFEDASKDSQ